MSGVSHIQPEPSPDYERRTMSAVPKDGRMKHVLQFAIVIALVIALAARRCPCTACFQGQPPKQSATAAAVQPWHLASISSQDWCSMLVVTLEGEMSYTACGKLP
jgi:hypothetical protein